jgi:HEAT repeat protein
MQALKDRTMTVRQRAVVALGRIKDMRALPALIEILLEKKRESSDAEMAIRKFGKKALPELVKAFERTDDGQLMLLLIRLKYEKAFDLLLQLLAHPEAAARVTAVQELGKLGDKRAIPVLTSHLHEPNTLLLSETVRSLGKLGAVETTPALLDLLVDDDLYGPRSSIYHAVTDALQSFSGVSDEIKNAFPGSYPAVFNMAGAPISLPEAMGLVGNDPFQEALSRLQGGMPEVINRPPGIPDEVIRKVVEEMSWKFGVMFADARDASEDRVRRLVELLQSKSNLTRAAAALTLPWYTNEGSLVALQRATRDTDEIVRRSATWASHALQKVVLYRKQAGL